jgi:hypothetical protein
MGSGEKLQNQNIHSFYRSPNAVMAIQSERLRWTGHVSRMDEARSSFKIFTGKPTR